MFDKSHFSIKNVTSYNHELNYKGSGPYTVDIRIENVLCNWVYFLLCFEWIIEGVQSCCSCMIISSFIPFLQQHAIPKVDILCNWKYLNWCQPSKYLPYLSASTMKVSDNTSDNWWLTLVYKYGLESEGRGFRGSHCFFEKWLLWVVMCCFVFLWCLVPLSFCCAVLPCLVFLSIAYGVISHAHVYTCTCCR